MEDQPIVKDAPDNPLIDMEDTLPMENPHNDEPHDISFDDTTDFYKEVDADVDIGVDWNHEDLNDADGDHAMNPIVDILQTLGVSASDAVSDAVKAIKSRPVFACDFGGPCNPTLSCYDPSFF